MAEETKAGGTDAKPGKERGAMRKVAVGLGQATGVSVIYRGVEQLVSETVAPVPRTKGRLDAFRAFFTRADASAVGVDPSLEPRRKFVASMRANGLSEADLAVMLTRTHRQFLLYGGAATVGVLAGTWSVLSHPLPSDWGVMMVFGRFVVVPIAVAMALRPAYLNWIVRHRAIGSLVAFLRSGDYLTKPSA